MSTPTHANFTDNNPLVSIIVPAYNAENTIGKCIESVQSQKNVSFECLIVVDGATDKTVSIAEEYSKMDKRVKTIVQTNQGRSAARNNGIRHAIGKWIMFMDADDMLPKDSLSDLTAIKNRDSFDIIYGNYITSSDASQKFTNRSGIIPIETAKAACLNIENITIPNCGYSFDNYNCRTCWGKLYSKKLFVPNPDVFPVGVGIGEDTLMNYTLISRSARIAFVDKPVYVYNVASPGTVRTLNLHEFDSIIALESYVREKCGRNPQDSNNLRFFLIRDFWGIYSRMSRYAKISQIPYIATQAHRASSNFILESLSVYRKSSSSLKGIYNSLRICLLKRKRYILLSLLLRAGGLCK